MKSAYPSNSLPPSPHFLSLVRHSSPFQRLLLTECFVVSINSTCRRNSDNTNNHNCLIILISAHIIQIIISSIDMCIFCITQAQKTNTTRVSHIIIVMLQIFVTVCIKDCLYLGKGRSPSVCTQVSTGC